MATIRERLDELKKNRKNRTCREVISLLEAAGAERRKKSGSHHTYTHPAASYPLTVPCHSEGQVLKIPYVKQAIQFVEEILEQRGDQE